MPRGDVAEDRLSVAAAQVEVFQPDEITLAFGTADDGEDTSVMPGKMGEMKQVVRTPAS